MLRIWARSNNAVLSRLAKNQSVLRPASLSLSSPLATEHVNLQRQSFHSISNKFSSSPTSTLRVNRNFSFIGSSNRPRVGHAFYNAVSYSSSTGSSSTTTSTTANQQQQQGEKIEGQDPVVSAWLFTSAALVFGMIVIGAITRLTESGLSIVDWKPIVGILPPMTDEAWREEFEKYKQFPEYQTKNYNMTLDEFKQIFFWEWFHRAYGRCLGFAFALPMVYFVARRRITPRQAGVFSLIFCLGGLQGAVGWWMVKSGLSKREDKIARVSHLRLMAHLASAFVIYSSLLYAAMNWRKRIPYQLSDRVAPLRRAAHGIAGLIFLTSMSGALVAGLDAGLIYNGTFPHMGNHLFPSEGLTLKPLWRNFIFNDATVQFDHRWLAITTGTAILSLYAFARRGSKQSMYALLPRESRLALNALALGVVGQITLGISTLMLFVPVHLAATHQV